MLRKRRLAGVLVATAVLLALFPATPAQAQDCDFVKKTGPDGDEIFVWTCSEGGSGGGGEGEQGCFTSLGSRGARVPCTHSTLGWFANIQGGCYIRPMRPQPAADDPRWEGKDPADGMFYIAHCFALEGANGLSFERLGTPIFLSNQETPIGQLLEEAIARLPLDPDIRLAPDPDGVGLVGLPVWMWTPPNTSTWNQAEASATSLDTTLRVRANGEEITWEMGDGQVVHCDSPGTPYESRFGAEESPTCGHVYEEPSRAQPGGRYTITATTRWRIDWWVDGDITGGTLPATRTETASVRINELQVVTS